MSQSIENLIAEMKTNRAAKTTSVYGSDRVYQLLDHIDELTSHADAAPSGWVNQVMSQAQVFASTYALVGGRFDDGTRMQQAEDEKLELRNLVSGCPAPPESAERTVDEIVTALYRRFKDWSRRGFTADDVTWCEVKADVISLLTLRVGMTWLDSKFKFQDRVLKTKGSSWHGRVVGFYTTEQTPIGCCVESEREPGSVQLYPEAALAIPHEEEVP